MNSERTARARQALVTVTEYLVSYLRKAVPGADRAGVDIDVGECRTMEAEGAAALSLTFMLPAETMVDGRLRVENYGGNVYYVTIVLEGEPQRFHVCMPKGPDHLSPGWSTAMCQYLTTELKRIVGERILTQTGPVLQEVQLNA